MAGRTDNFTRADSTSSLGTPSDGGTAWYANEGTCGISTDRAYPAFFGTDVATLNYNSASVLVSATFASTPHGCGIVGRWQANTDGIYLLATTGSLVVCKIVGGTTYTIGTDSGATVANGDVISLLFIGSMPTTVSVFQNGTRNGTIGGITVSDSSLQSSYNYGLIFPGSRTGTDYFSYFQINDQNPSSSGGVVVGGTAPGTLTGSATSSGGAVVGGTAAGKGAFAGTSSGGVVVGGSSRATVAVLGTSTGGPVVGGDAAAFQSGTMTSSGGVVAGGHVAPVGGLLGSSSGGAVVGGSVQGTPPVAGGAFVGSSTGGAVAGGTAPPLGAFKGTSSGGAVVGGAPGSGVITAAVGTSTGGIVVGGHAVATATGVFSGSSSGGVVVGGTSGVSGASGSFKASSAGGAVVGGHAVATYSGPSVIKYHIYWNHGTGGPIDFTSPIGDTALLYFDAATLSYPCDVSYLVRAYDAGSGLEEQNGDARVRILVDASGHDVSLYPKAVVGLTATAKLGGTAKVAWSYPPAIGTAPTGFKVYLNGTLNQTITAPPGGPGLGLGYSANLTGLTGGTVYTVGVTAFSAAGEGPISTVSLTGETTGPDGVMLLTATAIP